MIRSLLALAVLLLAAPVHAAFVVTPPDAENPIVDGWILVKLPAGQGHPWQIEAEDLSGTRITTFAPDAMTHPNIHANYSGPQFWLDDAEPTFALWEPVEAFGGWTPSQGHRFQPEVAADLDELTLTREPIVVAGRTARFRIDAAGGYFREYEASYPFPVPEPECAWLVTCAYCGILFWLRRD